MKNLISKIKFMCCFSSYSLLWRLGIVEIDDNGLPKDLNT